MSPATFESHMVDEVRRPVHPRPGAP